MGALAGQHNHCVKQADSRGSPLRPRKMDIDLEPWLNGLNYRVVLVAGQSKERDEREEEEEERRENRGGGRDKREEEEEKQGVLKESICLCLQTAFFLLASIAHPAALCNHAVLPSIILVFMQFWANWLWRNRQSGGLSFSIQPRLLSSKNANCMLGAKEDASSWIQNSNDPSESVNLGGCGRPAVAVGRVWYKQLINQPSSFKLLSFMALLMVLGPAENHFLSASPVSPESWSLGH